MAMSSGDTAKYKTLYVQTARVYLNDMHKMVLLLLDEIQNESKLSDSEINTAFIAAHSLGGQSAVIGYPNITQCCSLIEKIFKANIEEDIPLKKETLQHIYAATKKMLLCVDEIEKSGKEIDLREEIEGLRII